ncbi:MAG: NAD-dependent epimerase/dehydratase family protein [Steroidobacteraceae bacterium]
MRDSLSVRVLVTGANGFVGSALCHALVHAGHMPRAALRNDGPLPAGAAEKVIVGDISLAVDWGAALNGVDAIVHAAARAHILHDSPDNARLYRAANSDATRRLADAAARAGVRRFIYVSSIKVNGEESAGGAYTPADPPNPQDAYGQSKLLAENAVLEVSARTGMEVAIVRPPLVYGPGVRANFLRLLRWVEAGRPLPLGSVNNRRSLVSIWNLCDLLVRLLHDPTPSGRVWLVSDAEDLSTPDLIRRIGGAMGRKVTLLPVPVPLLQGFAALAGKRAEITRLCGSLSVDVSQTRSQLAWSPPVPVSEALARTVAWYRSESRSRGR